MDSVETNDAFQRPWIFIHPSHEDFTDLGTLVDATGSVIRACISEADATRLIESES